MCRPSPKRGILATRSDSGWERFAGTANDVVEILNKQVARIMALPDVKERVATIGFDPTLSSSQELAAHMKAETNKWSQVVRQANIRID